MTNTDRVLGEERRQHILARIQRNGFASINELADEIDVSKMTIRRDIDALSHTGAIEKLHGGAKLPGGLSTDEPGFDLKRGTAQQQKAEIARETLSLITPGLAIGIGAGTTTWALAKLLCDAPRITDLTVVTNSVPVADVFHRHPVSAQSQRISVVLTGGTRTRSDALVGPVAVSSLESLHLDVLFLGVHGVLAEAAFTTPNLTEAETNRAFIRSARRIVILADHSKWGLVGMSTIARLDEVDVFVSDEEFPEGARDLLVNQGMEVRIAGR